VIIGTAGHVDHGKTTLVAALTGIAGDRLKEEKARGITIDLGFAYLPIDNDRTLGFIDVPGHERFVHTMLAGASGIDFVLLVIAADDGIRPQTLEHLAIIDLLGIEHGAVALTKCDVVSPERVAAVADEIRSCLVGTVLEGADVLPVSAVTRQGIDELRTCLAGSAMNIRGRPTHRRFRLAVDRVFTLQGVGIIVTGTVLSGSVHVGDRVSISPPGLSARVRSLHAQNRAAQGAQAGDRCALNLVDADISKEDIRRGDMVLDPALHAPTDRIDATLRVLPGERKPIGQWFPVRLHHAAAEVGAHIVLLHDDPIQPGGCAEVQLVLDRQIAAVVLDRYVIRDVSAQRTIGGGRFIDLRPPARRRRSLERRTQLAALALDDPAAAFTALLAGPPYASDVMAFARDRALTAAATEQLIADGDLIVLEADQSKVAISPERWRTFVANLLEQLAAYHAENPDLQGIGRERLRLLLQPRLSALAFLAALRRATEDGKAVLDGSFMRLAAHTASLAPNDEAAWVTLKKMLAGAERFQPPRVRDIAHAMGRPEHDVRRLFKLLSRMGLVDEVAHDHFFQRSTVHEMVAIIVELASRAESDGFKVAEFRDRLANGRKVAIQILEFFDRHGVTLRRGDLRRADKHRLDLFGPVVLCFAGADGGESSPVGRSDFKSE
jgi:selenocysteine-specific elongation factor